MTLKQLLALFTLAALWGGSYLLIRVAVPVFGPFSLMASRVVIAGALLWIGLRLAGSPPAGLRANAGRLLILGAVNGAIPFTLIARGELRLTASLAAVLGATVPLFSVLIAAVWLRQRISIRSGAGLVLGVAGVGILVGWSPFALTRDTVLSIGSLLVAAASYGFSGLFTKQKLSGVPSTTLAFGQQVGAAVWLVVPALLQPPRFPIPTNVLWAVILLAALCTSCAFVLYFYLIAEVGPVRTQTVTYLIPVFGMLWGALFLGERVTTGMLVGLGVILLSVLLVNRVRIPLPAALRSYGVSRS
jgi:drug/metabolite transporter (DMT)-like permease